MHFVEPEARASALTCYEAVGVEQEKAPPEVRAMQGTRVAASGPLYSIFGGRFPAPWGAGEGGEGRGALALLSDVLREGIRASGEPAVHPAIQARRGGRRVEMTYAVKREDKRFNLRERGWKPSQRSEHAPPRQGPTHLTGPVFLRVGS